MADPILQSNPYGGVYGKKRSPWDPTLGPEQTEIAPVPEAQVPGARPPQGTPGLVQGAPQAALGQTTMSESEKYFQAMQKARANRPMTDRYQGLMEKPPSEKDYAASNWRRLGAGVVGAAAGWNGTAERAVEASSKFVRAPYNQAMERYNTELEAAKGAAGIEQKDIGDTISAMENAAKYGLDYSKYEEMKRQALEDEKVANRGVAVEEGRLSQAERKLIADGWEHYYDLDGSVVYHNAISGEYKRFMGGNPIQVVDAATRIRGADTADTNAATYARSVDQADARGRTAQEQRWLEIENETKRLGISAARAGHATPAEQGTAYIQVLRELQSDPNYAKYVKVNPVSGDLYIVTGDIDQDEYDELRGEIQERWDFILRRSGVGGDVPGFPSEQGRDFNQQREREGITEQTVGSLRRAFPNANFTSGGTREEDQNPEDIDAARKEEVRKFIQGGYRRDYNRTAGQ